MKYGMRYFYSIWNYLDMAVIVMSLLSTSLDLKFIFADYNALEVIKSINSLTLFCVWVKLISHYKGYEGTAFMIRMLIKVAYDIVSFLIIMLLIMISFSFSSN